MISPKDLTAVILAGGNKQEDVPSLQQIEGKKVIERQAAVLKSKASRIEVSVPASVTWSRFPLVVDKFEPVGPLSGIASALDSSATDYVLIVGGAFAWIRQEVIDLLVARSGEPFDACAFRFNYANPNPFLAVYHRRCAPRAIARLERGDRDAVGLLTSESLAVRWIEDYELQSFDPEMATFKKVSTGLESAPAQVGAPNPTAATAPTTITIDPGETSFAFQAAPAYQTALALVPIAQVLGKLTDAELGAQLMRTSVALLIALAEGGSARSAAFACAAVLDAARATGVSDPRIAEGQALLAAIVRRGEP